jgi:hypothetical protein
MALTVSGEGVASATIYCKTDEDIAEPPSIVKALATSSTNSILVSWLKSNYHGTILHYTVYCKQNGHKEVIG